MYNDLLQSEKEMVREIDELRMALMKVNQGFPEQPFYSYFISVLE